MNSLVKHPNNQDGAARCYNKAASRSILDGQGIGLSTAP